ncbi:MAG TPA: YbaB/EbfC family nucleoid-associated protein [bacterium]|nr:YbaB/EbfC family nucleoid-associated protein [bacterium]HPP86619.1 YbaB/EbfC family nucleoid-associated protein [bacterium]
MSRKFGGFGGGNMNQMLKQVKQMQNELLKAQETLKNTEFEGIAAGGMVSIKLTGNFELKSLKIDKNLVDPEDVELLEDSIIAAYNDAAKKVQEANDENFGGLAGGLNIPGLNL